MGKAAPRESAAPLDIDTNAPASESGPGYFSQAYSLTEGGLPSLSPAQQKGPACQGCGLPPCNISHRMHVPSSGERAFPDRCHGISCDGMGTVRPWLCFHE